METLNDLDKQFLKRNQKLLNEIRYDRTADNALSAVREFEKELYNSFQTTVDIMPLIEDMYKKLAALKAVNPWKPKTKQKSPES